MEQIQKDYTLATLPERQRVLCDFARKLTLTPSQMQAADLDMLRVTGLSEEGILDAVQVISYFNYINRIADALGIDPENMDE